MNKRSLIKLQRPVKRCFGKGETPNIQTSDILMVLDLRFS